MNKDSLLKHLDEISLLLDTGHDQAAEDHINLLIYKLKNNETLD